MTKDRAANLIRAFAGQRLLVIGDLMLDEFIWGKVSRISPEAPVPVVEVVKQSDYPGGAANVARNLREFTAGVELLGMIGQDDAGRKLYHLLESESIGLGCLVTREQVSTIVKTRIIARQQQLVRVDRETRQTPPIDVLEEALRKFKDHLPALDAVIIEDYGKGFLTQKFLDEVVAACREAGKIVTGDPNIHSPLRWSGLTAVKPNRAEAMRAANLPPDMGEEDYQQGAEIAAEKLRDLWDPDYLLITLGEHGMWLQPREGQHHHTPTKAREVFDVSGAGDTAIAVFTLALCAGATAVEAAELSNHASGVVVGKLGTATVSADELLASFDEQ